MEELVIRIRPLLPQTPEKIAVHYEPAIDGFAAQSYFTRVVDESEERADHFFIESAEVGPVNACASMTDEQLRARVEDYLRSIGWLV